MLTIPARALPIACLLLAALAGPARAQAAAYALDPVHTRIVFAIDHAGFSKALGTVSGSTGTLHFDPDDWNSARVDVRIPLARLDLGDDAWNRATLARNLLDADRHPQATFVSTRIEPIDAARATVHGLLTLRGVSREVALDVSLNASRRHPLPPFRRTVGFSASTTFDRRDFGIDAWPTVVGQLVELRIEAEATRTRADDAPPADAGHEPPPATDDTGAAQAPQPLPEPSPTPDPETAP